MHKNISSSPVFRIPIPLFVHVFSVCRSACNLDHSYRRVLATKAYRTASFSLTFRVPPLGNFRSCNSGVRRATPFSTASSTTLLFSTQTASSLSFPPASRTFFRCRRRRPTRVRNSPPLGRYFLLNLSPHLSSLPLQSIREELSHLAHLSTLANLSCYAQKHYTCDRFFYHFN